MKRILIVDDEELFRSMLREFLEGNGYACEEAKDGIQALQSLSVLKVDLVITDLVMPNMDGERLIHSMSEYDGWNSIPVICVSGDLSLSAKKFKKPVLVLEKPINSGRLLAVLKKLLVPEESTIEPGG